MVDIVMIDDRLANWAISLRDRKKPIGVFIEACYLLIVNPIIQSVVHGIAVALLGIFGVTTISNMSNDSSYDTLDYNWSFIFFWGLFYLIFIVASLICMSHRDKRNSLVETYEEALTSITQAIKGEYNEGMKLIHVIIEKPSLVQTIPFLQEYDQLQLTCQRLCDSIHRLLDKVKVSPDADFKVCVFLRTIDLIEDTYTLYSFDSSYNDTPEIYQMRYDLGAFKRKLSNKEWKNSKQLEQFMRENSIPYHALPFLKKENTGFVLKTGKDVEACYQGFSQEHPTKMHISIPIEIEREVLLALQITSNEHNALGSRENVKKIVNSYFPAYSAYIRNCYAQQLQHESILRKIEEEASSVEMQQKNCTN